MIEAMDAFEGAPPFRLREDQILTALTLVVEGSAAVRSRPPRRVNERRLCRRLMNEMVRAKRARPLLNMRIHREATVEDDEADGDDAPEGRIDICILFPQHFRHEQAYFGIEAKLLREDDPALNRRYVTAGVARFRDGLYGPQDAHGMMLGFVMQGRIPPILRTIDEYMRHLWGANCQLGGPVPHQAALAVRRGLVPRPRSGDDIDMTHAFVDMLLIGI